MYSIDIGMGFILLSGEVGTGKTTVCRSIIDTLGAKAEIVCIINPSLSGRALIASILDDLGVQYPADASKKDLIDQLNKFLLYRHCSRPVVIIIDDAQTMPLEALEDLRLLSNLETDKEKMLQMVIVGQPEIEDHLLRPEMRQLRQRIFVNCRLEHLKSHEVESYIDRRLFIAGSSGQVQFSRGAKRLIIKSSGGIPRIINKICDYSLTAGYVADEFVIRRKHVIRALSELGDLESNTTLFSKARHRIHGWTWARRFVLATALGLAAVLAVSLFLQPEKFKSLQACIVARIFVIANSLVADGGHPVDASAISEGLLDKQAHPSGKPQSSLISTERTDESKQPEAFNRGKIPLRAVSWVPAYHPFVIQLGSVKTFRQVARTVSRYAEKGLDIHWEKVNLGEKGRWYRIFAGHFESKTEALQAKRGHRLNNASIRFNPWTVLIGQYADIKSLTSIQSVLGENNFDSFIVESAQEISWLLTGAFASRHRAEKIVEELHKLSVSAQVVPR